MEVAVPVRVAPIYLRRRHHLYVNRAHVDENFSRRTMVVSRKPLRSQRRYQALDKGRKRGLVSNASALSTDLPPLRAQHRTVKTACSGLSDQHNQVSVVFSGVFDSMICLIPTDSSAGRSLGSCR